MRRRSRQDRYGWRSDLRACDPASSSPSGCVEQLHSASESRSLSTRIGSFVWRCLARSPVAPVFTPLSSNRTRRFAASGSRTRLHAFTHDGPPLASYREEPLTRVRVADEVLAVGQSFFIM